MLTITRYLDISPAVATQRLTQASASAPADVEVRISGIDDLTTVQVVVPWPHDRREATALEADRYATALTRELIAA
ncbi:MAG: hypothetical protein AAGC53_08890 [Actinomycetota bacterium]